MITTLHDRNDRLIGHVVFVATLGADQRYGWHLNLPSAAEPRTGSAASREHALRDAMLAAAALGVDGCRVKL